MCFPLDVHIRKTVHQVEGHWPKVKIWLLPWLPFSEIDIYPEGKRKNKIKSFIFPLVLKTFEKWNKCLYLRHLWQEKKQTTRQVVYFAKDKKKLRRYRFLRRKCLWTIVFNRRSSSWRARVRSAGLVVSCRRGQLQAINIALPQSSFILLEVVVSGFYYKRPKFMLTVSALIFNLRIIKWCY